MNIDIVTKQDLVTMREEIRKEFEEKFEKLSKEYLNPWMTDEDVMEYLQIKSRNTLVKIRIENNLPSTILGKKHYYKRDDVNRMLNSK